jgi:predicted DNA-binding protein (UPF0251 family)
MKQQRRRNRPRCIHFQPDSICFKPCGKRGYSLERIELSYDEMEALRLGDYEGLYQEEAAQQMGISRATFSRLIQEAHRKVAEALLYGKIIMIQKPHAEETK